MKSTAGDILTSPAMTPTLGACLIVKNEAHHLAACLDSICALTDHMVVVDTGSTDATVSIARQYTPYIVQFDWCDDFSAARNAGLPQLKTDWVLSLDADEVLLSPAALQQVLSEMDPRARPWVCQFVFVQGRQRLLKRALWSGHFGLRFAGRVHENLVLPDGQTPAFCDLRQIEVAHAPPAQPADKQAYYAKLIHAELQHDQPGLRRQGELYWHLALAYQTQNASAKAQRASLKALQCLHQAGLRPEIFDYSVLLEAIATRRSQGKMGAARSLAQQALQLLPRQAEGWYYLAWLQFWQGHMDPARDALQTARQCQARQRQHLQFSQTELSFEIDWLEIRLLAMHGSGQSLQLAIQKLESLYFQIQALPLLCYRVFLALSLQDLATARQWFAAWQPGRHTAAEMLQQLKTQSFWSPVEEKRMYRVTGEAMLWLNG